MIIISYLLPWSRFYYYCLSTWMQKKFKGIREFIYGITKFPFYETTNGTTLQSSITSSYSDKRNCGKIESHSCLANGMNCFALDRRRTLSGKCEMISKSRNVTGISDWLPLVLFEVNSYFKQDESVAGDGLSKLFEVLVSAAEIRLFDGPSLLFSTNCFFVVLTHCNHVYVSAG